MMIGRFHGSAHMTQDIDDKDFIRRLLTPAERRRIEEMGCVLDRSQDRTPERLFKNWQLLVEEVERGGYDWEIEEYMHSLWFRDDLEDVIDTIAPDRQQRIREAVTPWDLRFNAATEELAEPILGEPPERWWTYRVPRAPGTNFLESASGRQLRYEP
jgi:hypothetical protein